MTNEHPAPDDTKRTIGDVVHDLNNALVVISCSAALLRLDLDPTDPRSKDVQAILDAAEQATALSRQLTQLGGEG